VPWEVPERHFDLLYRSWQNAAMDPAIILPQVLGAPAGQPPFFAHYSYDEADELVVTFPGYEDRDLPGSPSEKEEAQAPAESEES